ncbi:MAG: hypothetical protein NT002_02165 [candidate division Zixibacteria bacterium]|nr:hypothetical protein [candidate division Zixibacteria bacterium]
MRYARLMILITLPAVLFLLTCSKKDGIEDVDAGKLLPKSFEKLGMQRTGDIRTFADNALWEYIDGGAEMYHLYNFIEVATADYKIGTTEMVIDIYRFDDATDAYGLYGMLRTDKPTIVLLGVEGFTAPSSIIFVKGSYLVRLMTYEETEAANKTLADLAQELNNTVPGATVRPNPFKLFPPTNAMGTRDKYYARSFLGHKFLTRVYSQDYLIGSDTVSLFLSRDDVGDKYLQWSEYAVQLGKMATSPDSLSYDSARVFLINDSFNGNIIAGLKGGKLLGMLNYRESHKAFLADWLNSLQ